MNEPHLPRPGSAPPRPVSSPNAAPVASPGAGPPAPPGPGQPAPNASGALRAAIDLVLADPDAVAEIIARAPPGAFGPALSEAEARRAGRASRHDGWTGERMARFLEVLADTGIVSEACRVAGMSREAAYQLRGRDPVFAAALAAAQTRARPVVADGLLERSITGTVEHYYRDGVLVGERRHYESWLGLAVLKRLDRQAEQDRADTALSARIADGWSATLDALRAGGTAAVGPALAGEVDEVDIPPPPGIDPWKNCWRAGSAEDPRRRRAEAQADGTWMTSFAPPPGFDGYENVPWDGDAWYERTCTAEEAALIDAHQAAAEAADRAELDAEAEAERDAFFAKLREELARFPSC